MRRETDVPVMAYVGEGRDIPGSLFQLHYPDGAGMREFLFDSWLEAQTFAKHYGAELTAEVPAEVSPLRALDPQQAFGESVIVQQGAGEHGGTHRLRNYDRWRAEDMVGLLTSGGGIR